MKAYLCQQKQRVKIDNGFFKTTQTFYMAFHKTLYSLGNSEDEVIRDINFLL